MLYVFVEGDGVMVSNVDPDSPEAQADWEALLKEAFLVTFPPGHKTPLHIEANVIRNKLANGGAKVEVK